MDNHKRLRYLNVLVVLLILCSCSAPAPQVPAGQVAIASESIANIIAKYQQEIPLQMQADNIPGLAIAIVDDKSILWEESFGYTDWDRQTPVTPATLFSIQSMSKSFTATAAMFAAQDGLVDLDAPITTYLPDFHVHSIFEEHPEQKMTLRILLSHTAGFPHDTAYGGNYDNSPYDFEKHIASISDTWLMFPVGTRYSYSNVGIDLAGYILQVRSGMPFTQYVQEKVLDPLGMKDSTLDYRQVRASTTRAIGHAEAPLRPPVDFMLLPSGGVWTSAEDMARYLQFHINKGALEGTRQLREDLAETMYTPPNLPANLYALGVVIDTKNAARHFQHGGGGFGFNDSMVWYPDLKLGSVVLTNAHQSDSLSYQLSEEVLDNIIASNAGLYADRAASSVSVAPAYLPSREILPLSDDRLQTMIQSKALQMDAAAQQRRSEIAGTYIITSWGFPAEQIEVNDQDGNLFYDYKGQLEMLGGSGPLFEVEPGLFYTKGGLTFDVRGPAPRFTEIPLVKVNTRMLPFQVALYILCGLAFLSALLFWPASAIYKSIRKKRNPGPDSGSRGDRWRVGMGILAGLAALFGLACLAAIALVPNLINVPWPMPYADLTWWQYSLVSLPFIGLGLGLMLAILAGLGLKSAASKGTQGYFLAVALTLLAFNLTLLLI